MNDTADITLSQASVLARLSRSRPATASDLAAPEDVRPVTAARETGIPVIHVGIAFRPGHPEVHPRNKVFAALPKDAFAHGVPSVGFHPALAPEPGEVTVFKNRIGAFAENDLERILTAGDVDHLVLAGIATGGVVLSTVCRAADLDHRLTRIGARSHTTWSPAGCEAAVSAAG